MVGLLQGVFAISSMTTQIGRAFELREIVTMLGKDTAGLFAHGRCVMGDTDHPVEKTLNRLQGLFQFPAPC